ncbi:unnamed protein product [Paramecium primaurelia]|uniref:Uncharacterized protein n=2 Tax=Paramecium TaxID=5884 RepID=A0A8S1LF70_PARPR|nr:unnamed protein product [Paramecium primaurelia]CAD8066414.1 unnamed protein product [Paramecium primaurelia]CAD8191093.1 unnamed protein product [Paramecium pentaurelia]CAD8191097.1 unnamed protein product [Paramecium pentaurelia]
MYLPTFYKLGYEAWTAKTKRFMGIMPAVGCWAVWALYPNLYNTLYTDFIPPPKGVQRRVQDV